MGVVTVAMLRTQLRERAWEWISRNDDSFRADGEAADTHAFIKRTAELATVAEVLAHNGDARGREMVETCWKRFECGAALARVAHFPAVVTAYVPFYRQGLRDAKLETALAASAHSATTPDVRLLVACALRACELPSPWDLEELLAASIIGQRPPSWRITDRDAYVITHVILYLAPTNALSNEHRNYLRRTLPVWIAIFGRAQHVDLVAELVMAAHALGDCVAHPEWSILCDAQEADGLVVFRSDWRGRVPPEQRFANNYHSTLVAFAACVMCTHN